MRMWECEDTSAEMAEKEQTRRTMTPGRCSTGGPTGTNVPSRGAEKSWEDLASQSSAHKIVPVSETQQVGCRAHTLPVHGVIPVPSRSLLQ